MNIFEDGLYSNGEKKVNGEAEVSVKSYGIRVFQDSTIGIVANIASTHSRARKIFKTFVLVFCVAGFTYQAVQFLMHVFEYPTTVDIDIQKPTKFERPALTFCNNNVLKRSTFCNMFPEKCFMPTDEFCGMFYDYCGKERTLVPKSDFYDLENDLNHEDLIKLTSSDFLREHLKSGNDTPRGPYLRIKDERKGSMLCYTLHSVVDVPEKPRLIEQNNKFHDESPDNILKFYVREDEMFIPGYRPGVLFSIHSPYEWINPFEKGIFLKPGRNYKIYVTMLQEVLLKNPFSTDCVNYEELWESNNRSGPRIQEMCREKCRLDASLTCLACAPLDILYPHNSRVCKKDESSQTNKNCTTNEEICSALDNCWSSCKDDCKVTKYAPSVMERYEANYDNKDDLEHFKRFITVEIFLEAGEIMTYRHSPKYLTVEVFSSIGGFIGCWLGISLMDIMDVFASIFSIIRYSLKKNKKRKEKLSLNDGRNAY